MGWVSLSLRKQSLQQSINDYEFRDIQLSRELRAISRNLSYQESVYSSDKASELAEAKEEWDDIKADRKNHSVSDSDYQDWYLEYTEAKEEYQEAKNNIENYYDDIFEDLEQEASDEESRVQEEQTQLETELEAMRTELDSIKESISSDIDATKLNLGN